MSRSEALQFDAEEHVYSLGGRRVPGVTNVLLESGIVDDRWFTEWARDRGSAVHHACELLDLDDLDEGSLDSRLTAYVDAWKRFTADLAPTWERIEWRVHHPVYGYAGTLDRLGTTPGGRQVLVDIKTGDPGAGAPIQLAAYAYAVRYPEQPGALERMAVQLKPDGTYKVHTYPVADLRHHFAVFQAALTLLRYRKEIF